MSAIRARLSSSATTPLGGSCGLKDREENGAAGSKSNIPSHIPIGG